MSISPVALSESFVNLANQVVGGINIDEYLFDLVDSCVELFAVDQAGVVLSDRSGSLAVVASTSDRVHDLELLQLNAEQGPCVECFQLGEPIIVADLGEAIARDRWAHFADRAREAGLVSLSALPMRAGSERVGALNLFGGRRIPLNDTELAAAQALADFAAIGIVQDRAMIDVGMLATTLQSALQSRVVIEQAKGKMAQYLEVSPDVAFAVLRSHARSSNRVLREVALDLMEGRIHPDELTSA